MLWSPFRKSQREMWHRPSTLSLLICLIECSLISVRLLCSTGLLQFYNKANKSISTFLFNILFFLNIVFSKNNFAQIENWWNMATPFFVQCLQIWHNTQLCFLHYIFHCKGTTEVKQNYIFVSPFAVSLK